MKYLLYSLCNGNVHMYTYGIVYNLNHRSIEKAQLNTMYRVCIKSEITQKVYVMLEIIIIK